MPAARVLVVTALPLELNAVASRLRKTRTESSGDGAAFVVGTYVGHHQSVEVWVTTCGQGNARAAAHTVSAVGYVRPNLAVFCGVAGGLKDVALGDIIVADRLYYYESGKVEATFKSRPWAQLASFRLEQLASMLAAGEQWRPRPVADSQPEEHSLPRVFVKPVVAGEKVLVNPSHGTVTMIRERLNDAVAVEMEGFGFYEALRRYPTIDAIVIRGISDLLGNKTEADAAGTQEAAARNAAAFALELSSEALTPKAMAGDQLDLPAPETPRLLFNAGGPRNLGFRGRSGLLQTLDSDSLKTQDACLTGPAGVGKTQLAREYCYTHSRDYDVVWWVSGESQISATEDLLSMASQLGLIGRAASNAEAGLCALRSWMRHHQGWLVVVDNVEEWDSILTLVGGEHAAGRLLYTSRLHAEGGTVSRIEVPPLSPNESVALLRSLGLESADTASLQDLAETLGDLPLALASAAPYLRATGTAPEDYVSTVLGVSDTAQMPGHSPPGDPDPMLPGLSSVSTLPVPASLVAEVLSFLDPGIVPYGLVREVVGECLDVDGGERPPPVEAVLQRTLHDLEQCAVISRIPAGVQMHRAVQQQILRQLKTGNTVSLEAALSSLAALLPTELRTQADRGEYEILLSHVLSVSAHCRHLAFGFETAAELLLLVAEYLRRSSQFRSSVSCAMDGLAMSLEYSSGLMPARLRAVIAAGAEDQGDFARAEAESRLALRASRRARLRDPLLEARINRSLALVLRKTDRLSQGIRLEKRVLASLESKGLSATHEYVQIHSDLAESVRLAGDHDTALELFYESLRLQERTNGRDSLEMAETLNNYACLLLADGLADEAAGLCERVLEIRLHELGRFHFDVGIAFNNLARVRVEQGQFSEAIPLLRQDLEISGTILPPEGPDVAATLNNLGWALLGHDELDEAQDCLEHSLRIRLATFGEGSASTAETLTTLSMLHERLDHGELAIAYARRARSAYDATLGRQHPKSKAATRRLRRLADQS